MVKKASLNNPAKWFFVTLYYVLTTIVKSITENGILIIALSVIPVFSLIMVTMISNRGKIRIHSRILTKYILGMTIFCYISAIWAENSLYAFRKGNNLLLIFLLTYSIYMCVYDERDVVLGFLKSIMWGGYIVVIYAFYRYGINYVISMLIKGVRIYNPILNTNEIGICAAYSMLICLYLLMYEGLNIVNIISLVLSVISTVMLAASGSRKALIALIAGTLLLFLLKNLDNKKAINSLIKIIGTISILCVIALVLSRLSIFEGTLGRIETMINGFKGNGVIDSSTVVRFRMIEIGKELFKKSPIIGIGMDNAQIYAGAEFNRINFYLHNNYIEMLANGGILGFASYYWIYIYTFFNMWKYRDFHKGEFNITLIIFLICMVMDYGMVTYETKNTYIFLMIFMFELDNVKTTRARKNLLSL